MLPGIGIFGTGPLVRVLIPILREKGFKIEALWSPNLSEAAEFAQNHQIPFSTNRIDDVLLKKEVDLIFVLCAPNLHAQISVKALGIGKHIVCDKPAGLNQEDALKMVKAGQYYPSLISLVNHPFRFLPAFVAMKKHIRDGYVGHINLIEVRIQSGRLFAENNVYDWRCDDLMGGGILNLVGSHIIDLITFITSCKAIKVHGIVRTFIRTTDTINGIRQITSPDFATFQMELEDNILVVATLGSYAHMNAFQQEITITGNLGQLTVHNSDLIGKRHNARSEELLYEDDNETFFNNALPRPYSIGLCNMVSALQNAFSPATGWLKESVSDAANFEDGLYVQAVLAAIKESNLNRQWVGVKIANEMTDVNAALSAAVRRTAISAMA